MTIPSPAPPRSPLPVGVGIAALSVDGRAAWALISSDGLILTAELPPGPHATSGTALMAAIENLLSHRDLMGREVMLFVSNKDHREDVRALAPSLGSIVVYRDTGSLSNVAAITVAETYPHLAAALPQAPEPEIPAAATRTLIATDGSVGRGPGRRIGGGFAWVAEDGRFGHLADEEVKHPLVAELSAIVAALRAHKRSQPVHIVCDNRGAIKVIKDAMDPARRTDPDFDYPSAVKKRLQCNIWAAVADRDITLSWVRSHSDPESIDDEAQRRVVLLNNAADRIAVAARCDMQKINGASVLDETVARVLADTFPLPAPVKVA